MKKFKRFIFPALLLAVLAAFSIPAISANSQKRQAAPNFTLIGLDGKKVMLSDFKGKVVILDFWATWCPPCRHEIPGFVEIFNKYKNSGLVVIGVALDKESEVRKFVKDNNITYPVMIGNQDVVDLYGGIRGIPTTFVIDKQGNVINTHVGYTEKDDFVREFMDNK